MPEIPMPPLTEGLQRVIDEPWRRQVNGVRKAKAVPNIILAEEKSDAT